MSYKYKLKIGDYHYVPHGQYYRIYVCYDVDENGSMSRPVLDEPMFRYPNDARRRVYELNGWRTK